MFIVLFLISSLTFSSCADFQTKGVVLNVSRRRPKGVTVLRQSLFTIDTLVYTAEEGYINEVVDNHGNIWKTDHTDVKFTKVVKFNKESKLLHVHLVLRSGDSYVTYFYRAGRVWHEISGDRFYNEFDTFRSQASCIGTYTLFLSGGLDDKKTLANLTDVSNYSSYSPSFGYRITRICEVHWGRMCFKSLWAQRNDEYCTFVSFHKGKKPNFAYLIISDAGNYSEKFYHKPKGFAKRWKELKREDYLEKVRSSGFDIEEFDNKVELDFNNVDTNKFYEYFYGYDKTGVISYPKPSFKLTKVRFKDSLIWESKSNDSFCNYGNIYLNPDAPTLCYLLLTDGTDRRVQYYEYKDHQWEQIYKSRYYHLLSNRDNPLYTHSRSGVDTGGDRKLEMSYFTNRQGLILRTYRSSVDNPKGVILLTHGFRIHFVDLSFRYNVDWNFKNFGFAVHPYIVCPDVDKYLKFAHLNTARFKEMFEYYFYGNEYPMKKIKRFEYTGSMLESLNNMGYTVYGYDLQSHGYSEGIDSIRTQVLSMDDHKYDFLQYVSIIKRGRFLDTSEKWDESLVKSDVRFENKFFILGRSYSTLPVFRAIQHHYGDYKSNQSLADAVVFLSGAFGYKTFNPGFLNKLMFLTSILSVLAPRSFNTYFPMSYYSHRYEFTMFLNDDKYSTFNLTWRNTGTLMTTYKRIIKDIKKYPKNLQTLFIQSEGDRISSIKEVRNLIDLIGGGFKSIDLPGRDHQVLAPPYVPIISRELANWIGSIC